MRSSFAFAIHIKNIAEDQHKLLSNNVQKNLDTFCLSANRN